MTGPEHYVEAEKHASLVAELMDKLNEANERGITLPAGISDQARQAAMLALERGQLHATLALAAATAMAANTPGGQMEARDFRAWDNVAGVQ